jgi:YggT family protein
VLYQTISLLIQIIKTLILIRIIISWVLPYSRNEFTHLVYMITEPLLKPFRVLLPIGNLRIDIAPLLAYFTLDIIRKLIFSLLFF